MLRLGSRRWASATLLPLVLCVACGGRSASEPDTEVVLTGSAGAAVAGGTGSAGAAGAGGSANAGAGSVGGGWSGVAGSPVVGASGANGTADPAVSGPCPEFTVSVFVEDARNGMELALTDTHVYWAGSGAIMRRAKVGGPIEMVVATTGRAPFIDSGRLYWSDYPNIYGMALDAAASPVLLATHATNPNGWAVFGDRVYFTDDGGDREGGLFALPRLMSASSNGGDTPLFVHEVNTTGPVAADPTGVYWYDDERASWPDGGGPAFVKKYTLANQQVTDFASVEAVEFLRADGGHVAWAAESSSGQDPTIVWSSAPDGNRPVALGAAPLVRQLAIDESSAYWAASAPGDSNSDIVTAALTGGPSRTIACHVSSVYALAVDATDLYFSTWLEHGIIGRIPKRPP